MTVLETSESPPDPDLFPLCSFDVSSSVFAFLFDFPSSSGTSVAIFASSPSFSLSSSSSLVINFLFFKIFSRRLRIGSKSGCSLNTTIFASFPFFDFGLLVLSLSPPAAAFSSNNFNFFSYLFLCDCNSFRRNSSHKHCHSMSLRSCFQCTSNDGYDFSF